MKAPPALRLKHKEKKKENRYKVARDLLQFLTSRRRAHLHKHTHTPDGHIFPTSATLLPPQLLEQKKKSTYEKKKEMGHKKQRWPCRLLSLLDRNTFSFHHTYTHTHTFVLPSLSHTFFYFVLSLVCVCVCVCVCLLNFDQLIQAQRVESRTGQAGQFSIFRRRVKKKRKKKATR